MCLYRRQKTKLPSSLAGQPGLTKDLPGSETFQGFAIAAKDANYLEAILFSSLKLNIQQQSHRLAQTDNCTPTNAIVHTYPHYTHM